VSANIDPEWVALTAGLKPAIRVTVEPGGADDVATRFRGQGLKVVMAATTVPIGGRQVAILYVARTEEDATLLRAAEARALPGHEVKDLEADLDAHREIGRRLGFPACCVEAFCQRVARGIDRLEPGGRGGMAEDYVAARGAWIERPDPRLNNLLFLARYKLLSCYPCRYDCETALRYAEGVRQAIEKRQRDAERAIMAALTRPVVIAPQNVRAVVELGEGRTITRAEAPRDPSGRTVHPGDEPFAATLVGKAVGPDGAVTGTASGGMPPAWLVPFGVAL
jgi:hypothetical protein